MKILILGTPRSGTMYLTKVLQSFYLDVRHEAIGADGMVCGFWAWQDHDKADWLPCKHRNKIHNIECDNVFHLHRHPLLVMNSLPDFFSDGKIHNVENWFKQVLGKDQWQSPERNALLYWVYTHKRLLSRNLPKIAIENINTDWSKIAEALKLTKQLPNIGIPNSSQKDHQLTWSDLESWDIQLACEAKSIAQQLGYNY